VTTTFYARYMVREARGSVARLAFFAVCLAVGVAAVVAVAGLSRSLDDGVRLRARELLAADLVVESRRALPAELASLLATVEGTRSTLIREMVTVTAAIDGAGQARASRLVELKVPDGDYPHYGVLELDPPAALAALLDAHSCVIARELYDALSLERGATLRIGHADFTIAGAVVREPDRVGIGFQSISPRIFLSPDGLERTGLLGFGSRVTHRALVRTPDGTSAEAIRRLAELIRTDLPDAAYVNVETYEEAQPQLRRGLERVELFLGLVALMSLLIGGIGVAQTVRAWIAGRMEAIAILKCLGLTPREILAIYLGQAALLGLLGSVAGAVLGAFVLLLLPGLLGGVVPPELIDPVQPLAIARGLALGLSAALLFSLHPLLAVYRVPPARAFRREAEPLPHNRPLAVATIVVLLGGMLAMATVQTGDVRLAAGFVGAIIVVVGALALTATLLARALGRWPRRFARVWVRHGLAAPARPGAATTAAIVALGLGVLSVVAMYVVETRLHAELDAELPVGAPTAFLVNIQPDQWPTIERMMRDAGAEQLDSVPMVSARLATVDGVAVADLVGEGEDVGRRRWVFTREQRITYLAELQDRNEIVEGELWSDPDVAEVSIEADFARDLGAGLGTRLVFDVQGVPIELTVTSIRTVDWSTYGINFFLVAEPGALDDAPQSRVAAARFPRDAEPLLQRAVVTAYPNVSLIPIRQVLETIVGVLRQVGRGVRVLGGFTVIAGALILAGVVSAGSIRRGREVALLKALGMTGRGVVAMYSLEYGLIGAVAGLLGVAGGSGLAALVLTRWMDIAYRPRPLVLTAALAVTVLLAIGAGTLASARSLRRRPIEVLRADT